MKLSTKLFIVEQIIILIKIIIYYLSKHVVINNQDFYTEENDKVTLCYVSCVLVSKCKYFMGS